MGDKLVRLRNPNHAASPDGVKNGRPGKITQPKQLLPSNLKDLERQGTLLFATVVCIHGGQITPSFHKEELLTRCPTLFTN